MQLFILIVIIFAGLWGESLQTKRTRKIPQRDPNVPFAFYNFDNKDINSISVENLPNKNNIPISRFSLKKLNKVSNPTINLNNKPAEITARGGQLYHPSKDSTDPNKNPIIPYQLDWELESNGEKNDTSQPDLNLESTRKKDIKNFQNNWKPKKIVKITKFNGDSKPEENKIPPKPSAQEPKDNENPIGVASKERHLKRRNSFEKVLVAPVTEVPPPQRVDNIIPNEALHTSPPKAFKPFVRPVAEIPPQKEDNIIPKVHTPPNAINPVVEIPPHEEDNIIPPPMAFKPFVRPVAEIPPPQEKDKIIPRAALHTPPPKTLKPVAEIPLHKEDNIIPKDTFQTPPPKAFKPFVRPDSRSNETINPIYENVTISTPLYQAESSVVSRPLGIKYLLNSEVDEDVSEESSFNWNQM
jgi:hypothetical protein